MAWTLRVGLWFSCMTFSGLIHPGDKNCVRRDTELGVDFTSASVPKADLWVRVSCKAKVQVLLDTPDCPLVPLFKALFKQKSSNSKPQSCLTKQQAWRGLQSVKQSPCPFRGRSTGT